LTWLTRVIERTLHASLCFVLAALLGSGAVAQGLAPQGAALGTQGVKGTHAPPVADVGPSIGATEEANSLYLHNRKIVTFRATLLGDSPDDRVKLASLALETALKSSPEGKVTHTALGDAVRFELDGATLFFLSTGDFRGPRPAALLNAAAQDVLDRLQTAIEEHREFQDPKRWAKGAGYSLLATVLAYTMLRALWWCRRQVNLRMRRALEAKSQVGTSGHWLASSAEHVLAATRATTSVFTWGMALLLGDAWATCVLHQFAYTRPWGERSTAWLTDVLQRFVLAIAGAVPGLLTAVLIFVLARMFSRVSQSLLEKVEQGETQLPWLDRDTAMPTRRLVTAVTWLFALAMAYPYLPGAGSEAFKGVTVLAGLMLSLGASNVVGQVLSGLSLMYSRSLRVGEYVKVGDTEGTVVALGMFTTKVHTGMGEEVSLPNNVVFGQPIRNFSRLVKDGSVMLHTSVTIGYATPWRQVHAMLLEAASRTAGVARDPSPYVVQTALSDFYVEYRLCAQSNKNAPSRRIEAMNQLHANVLDVFNEQGVQIMSPHYLSDPAEPQIVPPGKWSSESPQNRR